MPSRPLLVLCIAALIIDLSFNVSVIQANRFLFPFAPDISEGVRVAYCIGIL